MTMSPELGDAPFVYESIVINLEPTNTSARNDEITREIRLTADKPTAKIGRASKTVSKGLVPAIDNAYFDSPVVSRAHAEITGNFVDGSISVTDMGSLHGTSVNQKPLEKDIASVLKQDDVVSFGIHVSRGLDVFYPTSCKVKLVRTPIKPAERARSYCAPDSDDDDGLSDGSGASVRDCTSVYSHPDEKVSTSHNAKSKPIAIYEVDDDSSSSDDDIVSVEDITFCPETEVLPALGEFVNIGRRASDEMDEDEDDEEGDVDYGEVDEDDEVEDTSEDDEEEDDEEDEEEEERNEEEEAEHASDVEGDYLVQELRYYSKDPNMYNPPSPMLGKESTPSGGDSLPVHGLWTPPSISAEDVATLSRIVESEFRDEQEEPAEEEAASSNGDAKAANDGKSLLLNDSLPRSVSAKFDISSLLNPSPPTSSPAKAQTDDTPTAPGAYVETQADMFATFETLDTIMTASADEVEEARMKIGMVIDPNPEKTAPPVLPPIVADLTSLAAANGSNSLGVGSVSIEQRSRASVSAGVAEADEGKEGVVDDEEEDVAEDSAAMTSAATFLQYKKRRANKKRKADEMLADAAGASSSSAAAAATEAPSAKRPATPAAVAAKKKAKGPGWAFAEKIGLAALGGAVVLGSLIYTAPSF